MIATVAEDGGRVLLVSKNSTTGLLEANSLILVRSHQIEQDGPRFEDLDYSQSGSKWVEIAHPGLRQATAWVEERDDDGLGPASAGLESVDPDHVQDRTLPGLEISVQDSGIRTPVSSSSSPAG
jgi:hypothetical protein